MDWLTPGIIIGLLMNLVTIAALWGKMNANMANFGVQMERIAKDLHDINTTVVELGKLAATLTARVESHERKLDVHERKLER